MTASNAPGGTQTATLKQSLSHADQSIRFIAALELAKLGDADSIPALIEGFQADGFITRLYQAGRTLATLGDAAVPALTDALTAANETVCVGAFPSTINRLDDPTCSLILGMSRK